MNQVRHTNEIAYLITMSTIKDLIRETVREVLLAEKAGYVRDFASDDAEMDDFLYDTIARKIVWAYEDGTVGQDVKKLVDNYVKAYRTSHGIDLDGKKLYDAVVVQMETFKTSTNVRSFAGGGGR